jgi:hypothetical protein
MIDWISDVLARQWTDLLARPSGPFGFRFLLQPTMAAIAGIKDGLGDGRAGRTPYFWAILTGARERRELLREGLKATGRIILLGLIMDAVYQYVALKTFYPVEALIISLLLAFVPYVLIRGPVARLARRTGSRPSSAREGGSGAPGKRPHL